MNDLYFNGNIFDFDWFSNTLDFLSPFVFHLFAIGVPIYFLLRWIITKDKHLLYISMLSTIPFILFIIWLYFALKAL
ncbi:MAG: hypothetical protein ACLFPM_07275 [Candidatus Izemoplasmatales bacterium]